MCREDELGSFMVRKKVTKVLKSVSNMEEKFPAF